MNNFREIEQKGGLAQIKIDNGFIYNPKYDEPVENHSRYCDGRLYCKTGYRPSGCTKCVKIPDDAPPSITTRQMRRDSNQMRRDSNQIDDEIISMLNSMPRYPVSISQQRGGRRRRKTRRQRKSRRRQRKSRRAR